MPGLIDVTGWSDQDIKRLSQMDDDDFPITKRNPYAYRKPVNRTPKPIISYNADDVWAAAVQAYDVNGGYVKFIENGSTVKETNKQIVDRLLSDPIQIQQVSRDKAIEIRQYYKGFTFKILQGKTLNEFNNTAMLIAERDVISSNYDIAVITSLPASYQKATKRDNIDRRINFANGGFLGNVGDKVSTEIEVLKQIWSEKWMTWYVTGITDSDQVLFFAYRKQLNVGDRVKIQGTVKGHRDNSTQLNRVKVV